MNRNCNLILSSSSSSLSHKKSSTGYDNYHLYYKYYNESPLDHFNLHRPFGVLTMFIFSSLLCLVSCHFSTVESTLSADPSAAAAVKGNQFKYNSTLTVLDIKGNPVHEVEHDSFSHLTRLKAL